MLGTLLPFNVAVLPVAGLKFDPGVVVNTNVNGDGDPAGLAKITASVMTGCVHGSVKKLLSHTANCVVVASPAIGKPQPPLCEELTDFLLEVELAHAPPPIRISTRGC